MLALEIKFKHLPRPRSTHHIYLSPVVVLANVRSFFYIFSIFFLHILGSFETSDTYFRS